ncbi:MAG: ABC transporter ATP-binding protein [Lentisphaerae bacterium]|nr:ABC transporter ATP-binding protein [Lentisphaerota bacterium]
MEPAVKTRGLTKVFADFWCRPRVRAVSGLDLDIVRGEVFGLLGPNGSGKSTTIKLLLGLLHPSAGSVEVLSRRPDDVATKKLIGYLPEESYLYRYLTARETLDFYGRLFDIGARQRAERTEQLLEMVGLAQAADRPVGEFSKGMARRIGLAQALINDPALLVLDEPTSGLDPIGCRQIKDLIVALAKRGKTILLCSHLLADVEDVCDRIAILYNGRLRAQGRVKDLLRESARVRITLPSEAAGPEEKLEEEMRRRFGPEVEVGHPVIELESFFLDVVQKAREGHEPDSGVGHEAGVPEYLRETAAGPYVPRGGGGEC